MRTLSVGVTGGIGSGKSEVCAIFASLGAHVINADTRARELMEKDESLASSIRREFGNVYTASGRLDASALGKIVFGDRKKLDRLNSLVHPAVTKEIGTEIGKIRRSGKTLLIAVEAALIFEAGITGLFDYIVAVQSGKGEQVERVMRRDGTREADVLRRIAAQLPPEEIAERADFVILNTSDLGSLRQKCLLVHSVLTRLSTDPG